jgi:DNA-binding transcriptional MerR regulator
MGYSVDDIIELADQVSDFKEIERWEIPYIDLYMDQVTTLFEDKLSHLKRRKDETILTKTMINNYAKSKILTPIKNKKYSSEQIMLLILIYNLKQVLSLEDIKLLLTPVIDELNSSSSTNFNELYESFLSIKKEQGSNFTGQLLSSIKAVTPEREEESLSIKELLLVILSLINSANLQKRMAEKLIDTYFTKTKD